MKKKIVNIYLGELKKSKIFNKKNSNDFILNLKNKLINKYNFKTYNQKIYYTDNTILYSNKKDDKLISFNNISYKIKDNKFFEYMDITEIPSCNYNIDNNYNEIYEITEFTINSKIKMIFNNKNHIIINALIDEYWDETENIIHNICN